MLRDSSKILPIFFSIADFPAKYNVFSRKLHELPGSWPPGAVALGRRWSFLSEIPFRKRPVVLQ